MSVIVIVGGHGKVALLLAAALTGRGHTVRSTIRTLEHAAEVRQTGAVPYLLDIESADAAEFAEALSGGDVVVFSAGAGGDGNIERKRTVDLGGSLKSIEAALEVGIDRFVQVSAIGVDEPLADDTDPVWRAYVEAKRDADIALRASDLDWTIVRPGRLTDGPATGSIAVAEHLPGGEISRADVADVIVAVLDDDATIGAQFELTAGDSTIAEALASLS